jgi:hypothetical protein
MAALDAGVLRRDVGLAARYADHRTTTIYDRRRQNDDRYAVVPLRHQRLTAPTGDRLVPLAYSDLWSRLVGRWG